MFSFVIISFILTFALVLLVYKLWDLYREYFVYADIPLPKDHSSILLNHLNLLESTPKSHLILEKWAREYGPIYRLKFGPSNIFVISDLEAVQFIMRRRHDLFERPPQICDPFICIGVHGIISSNGEEWKTYRKLISPCFTTVNVAKFRKIVIEEGIKIKDKLDELYGSFKFTSIKAADETLKTFTEFLYDHNLYLISRIAFGVENSDLYDRNFLYDFVDMLNSIAEHMRTPIPLWKLRLTYKERRIITITQNIKSMLKKTLDRYKESLRSKENNCHKDSGFMQILVDTYDLDDKDEESWIVSNMIHIFGGGYVSNVVPTYWILYYLAKYPQMQERLYKETRALTKDLKDISDFDYTQAVYAEAFIKEVLRLRPFNAYFYAESVQDVELLGHKFPERSGFILLLREASFQKMKNPYKFDPERWLENDPEKLIKLSNSVFSFGHGQRICPGKNFAMMEMIIILCIALIQYRIKFAPIPPGHESVGEIHKFQIRPDNHYVYFEKRVEV